LIILIIYTIITITVLLYLNKIKSSVFDVLSIGQNKFFDNGSSIHAESDAINRLKRKTGFRFGKKNVETVNLLVIRVTKTGIFGNSNPCIHCLKDMADKTLLKGYKIDYVYFSNDNNQLECYKLIDLIKTSEIHVSSYYKNSSYVNKWLKWRNSKF
jgi:hypothetical protein